LGDRAVCNEAAIAFFIQCALCAGAANRSNLRGILSFILLLLGSLFIGITVENPIVGNSIVIIIAALRMIGFWRLFPYKKPDLYYGESV
jgi:hypothetical protein